MYRTDCAGASFKTVLYQEESTLYSAGFVRFLLGETAKATKEAVYKAADSNYCQPLADSKFEEFMDPDKELPYRSESHSGGSSNTATAVTGNDWEAEGTANSLVTSQQDISQAEVVRTRRSGAARAEQEVKQAERSSLLSVLSVLPVKLKSVFAGSKPNGVAKKASKAGQATAVRRKTGPKTPPSPLELQALPRRDSPKEMWREEAFISARRQPQAEEEEDDSMVDSTADDSSSAERKVRKQRRSHHRKEQRKKKEGGPCAMCGVTKTPAWRRGAKGGSYAGQHLCNRCGVDQFRHPDSVEEGWVKPVRGRRRVSVSKRPNNPVKAESEQPLPQADWRAIPSMPFRLGTAPGVPPLFKDSCGPKAADTAAAAADRTTSELQRWHCSDGVVARVPGNSGLQLWAASDCTGMDHQTARESSNSKGVGNVQLGPGGVDKRCRKRLAEATTEQPSTKRWRLEAHPDSMGSMGQQHSSWLTADAAGFLGYGNASGKAGQEGVEGGLALHTNHAGLGVSSPAATRFQWFLGMMDQLASRVI
ncbi:hypothetical protein ABBQ38_012334 [Trebouxia sp. C0009 RCD-2024]